MYPAELNVPRFDNPTAPIAKQDFMQDEVVIGETNFVDKPLAVADLRCACQN